MAALGLSARAPATSPDLYVLHPDDRETVDMATFEAMVLAGVQEHGNDDLYDSVTVYAESLSLCSPEEVKAALERAAAKGKEGA